MKTMIALMLLTSNVLSMDLTKVRTLYCEYGFMYDFAISTSANTVSLDKTNKLKQEYTKIVIKNTDKPSEMDDWISISNSKGHKITYSLKCKEL